MDDYSAVYCTSGDCAALQWREWRGKPCQRCGGTSFVSLKDTTARPEVMFTTTDQAFLRSVRIEAVQA